MYRTLLCYCTGEGACIGHRALPCYRTGEGACTGLFFVIVQVRSEDLNDRIMSVCNCMFLDCEGSRRTFYINSMYKTIYKPTSKVPLQLERVTTTI